MKKRTIAICMTIFSLIAAVSYVSVYAGKGHPEALPEIIAQAVSVDAYLGKGYQQIAQNERLTLFFDGDICAFYVENRQTGTVFQSTIDPEYYSLEKTSALWKNNAAALFTFSYVDFNGSRKNTNNLTAAHDLAIGSIDDGIELYYDFTEIGIKLTARLTLTAAGVRLAFPDEGIIEDIDGAGFGLESIEPLPFFGAAVDEPEGYIFIPDGSGALMRFENSIDPLRNMQYAWPVYSKNQSVWKEGAERSQGLLMPVFGVKRSDTAVFGIITQGQFDANVVLAPSRFILGLNRVYASFLVRKSYEIKLPEGSKVTRMDKERIHSERSVEYALLEGAQADYSGMAGAYRNYLKDNHVLTQPDSTLRLELSLFGMCSEPGLLFERKVVMTTLGQAEQIVGELADADAARLNLSLIGFGKGGAEGLRTRGAVATRLGGSRGFASLGRYTQGIGVPVFLMEDYISAGSGLGWFSKRRDVVIAESGTPVSNPLGQRFIMNPQVVLNNLTGKYLGKYAKLGADGVIFEQIGSDVFDSFGKGRLLSRSDYAKAAGDMAQAASDRLGFAAATVGNDYLLPYIDAVYMLDYDHSGFFIIDESVPFYEMVVHGYIGYTTREYGNLTHDFEWLKLKWIEYGYNPSFIITWESPSLLKKTAYNALFSTQFSHWKDIIIETEQEFADKFAQISQCEMVSHAMLSENVAKVTYSNGEQVYVNYGYNSESHEGVTIPARDYIIR